MRLRAPLHVSDDDDSLMHAAMDYWETLTECMAKDWIVTVGYNPEHPEEHCAVTLRNWRTGAFWAVFGPTWDDVLQKAQDRVQTD